MRKIIEANGEYRQYWTAFALVSGDVEAYEVRQRFREAETGTFKVTARKPSGAEQFVTTTVLGATEASVVLKTGMYDVVGETALYLELYGADGGKVTEKVIYVEVEAGPGEGTASADEITRLDSVIAQASQASVQAQEQAAYAQEQAERLSGALLGVAAKPERAVYVAMAGEGGGLADVELAEGQEREGLQALIDECSGKYVESGEETVLHMLGQVRYANKPYDGKLPWDEGYNGAPEKLVLKSGVYLSGRLHMTANDPYVSDQQAIEIETGAENCGFLDCELTANIHSITSQVSPLVSFTLVQGTGLAGVRIERSRMYTRQNITFSGGHRSSTAVSLSGTGLVVRESQFDFFSLYVSGVALEPAVKLEGSACIVEGNDFGTGDAALDLLESRICGNVFRVQAYNQGIRITGDDNVIAQTRIDGPDSIYYSGLQVSGDGNEVSGVIGNAAGKTVVSGTSRNLGDALVSPDVTKVQVVSALPSSPADDVLYLIVG